MPSQFLAVTPEDTEEIGARLARALPDLTSGPAIVYLGGDLGAGKTTLARGFLRQCGHMGSVKSPTYTLVEIYERPDRTIVHLDLYRLRDPSELEPLGLRDLARPGHVWLVEWPERGEGFLPPADLLVILHSGEAGHTADIRPRSALGEAWCARIG